MDEYEHNRDEVAPEVDNVDGFRISRRSFLTGGVAVVAATGTAAAAPSTTWSVTQESDATGRRTHFVTHPKLAGTAYFAERSFGEVASISIVPRLNRKGKINVSGDVDFTVLVRGATLLPGAARNDRSFDLAFDFYHETDDNGVASIDVEAMGWIFGKRRQLVDCVVPKRWFDAAGIATERAADIGPRLLDAVFDGLISRPRKTPLTLAIVPPTAPDKPFRWRLGVVATPGTDVDPREAFSLSVGKPDTSAKRESFARTAIASGSSLELWRDPALAEGAGTAIDPKETFDFGGDDESAGIGPTTRGTLRDGVAASVRTVLAEHRPPKGSKAGVSCPIIQNFTVVDGSGQALAPFVAIERIDTGADDDLLLARVRVDGEFVLVTSPSSGHEQPLSEGVFPVNGPIEVQKRLGNDHRRMRCRLGITKSFRLSTSLGIFTASSPEERRADATSRRDAPPIRIDASSFTCIRTFEIGVRLQAASIAIPDDRRGNLTPASSAGHFAQLNFLDGGASVTLRLHALGDEGAAGPALGRIFLGFTRGLPADPAVVGPPLSIPMEQGALRLLRANDLVGLKYRFGGLDLTSDGTQYMLQPRGLAVSAALGGEKTLPSTAMTDPRPTLVVELPPQHRAEQAFFERRAERPVPPKLPTIATTVPLIDEQLAILRSAYASPGEPVEKLANQRLQARRRILASLVAVMPDDQKPDYNGLTTLIAGSGPVELLPLDADKVRLLADKDLPDFLRFASALAADTTNDWSAPPLEQRYYLGHEFVDPRARRYAERVQHGLRAGDEDGELLNALVDRLPVNPVSDEERAGLKENFKQLSGNAKEREKAVNDAIGELINAREPTYPLVKAQYEGVVAPLVKGSAGELPAGLNAEGLQAFNGREAIRSEIIKFRQLAESEDAKAALSGWLTKFVAYLEQLFDALGELPQYKVGSDDGTEVPTITARSRLSGPSRLAFRINTDDYEKQAKGGAIPLTVDDLTNFSRFELQVVRRAQKLFRAYNDGTRRPMWDAEEDLELSDMLVHQGFSRGGHERLKLEAGNMDDPPWADPVGERSWPEARVTVDQRLSEVVAAMREPTELETAIEIPFRLVLSPSQDALFRTPRGVPAALFGSRTGGSDTVGLWSAELDPSVHSNLRAVWSPDFRPEAFLPQETVRKGFFFPKRKARINRSPPRGPYAPWAIGRHLSSGNLGDVAEALKNQRFRNALDAFDRHELVALTSLHGLPVMGRVNLGGERIGKDQREPPAGFQVALRGTPPSDDPESLEFNDVYVPRPFDPDGLELALTSLGGYFNVNASFEPPAAVVDYDRGSLFDALSIERLRYTIVLGRDISAEVVYKGYLMPFGIRATLIKSTERVIELVPGRIGPVAILRQRMFIRIANPIKEFPAFRQSDEGRRVPFKKVQLLTTKTPDIVDPFDLAGAADATKVWPGGLIDLGARDGQQPSGPAPSGTPFWPRTARRKGAEVMFDILLDDTHKLRMPLVFVDNVTANGDDSLLALCDYYSRLGAKGTPNDYTAQSYLVQRPLFGQKLEYAPSLEQGDTQFETETLTFSAEGRRTAGIQPPTPPDYVPETGNRNFRSDAYMQGADQPPFYPAMRRATVRVGQMDRLTGRRADQPVTVGYDSTYALYGFDAPGAEDKDKHNKRAIFLDFATSVPLEFGNSGDRGGAVGRPESNVVALSRSTGPVSNGTGDAVGHEIPQGGEFAPIVNNLSTAAPKNEFPDNASILGLIKISDVIKVASLVSGVQLEPKLQEIIEFGGGLTEDADSFIRENVLVPLDRVLTDFDTAVRAIRFNELEGTSALKSVYPEVASSNLDFHDSVRNAIGAPPPSAGIDASIKAYTAVYSSGRRFAQAIERALRDPLTPIREAFRARIEGYVSTLQVEAEKAIAQIKALIAPDKLLEQFVPLAKDILIDASSRQPTQVAHLIFRLPLIAEELPAGSEEAVAEVLETALVAAIDANSSWPATTKQLFDFKAFGDTFVAVASQEASDKLLPAVAVVVDRRLKQVATKLEELEGLFWNSFDATVTAALQAFSPLAEIGVGSIGVAITTLSRAGQGIDKILKQLELLRSIGKTFELQCAELVRTLDFYARTVLPIDAARVPVGICLPAPGVNLDWKACREDPQVPHFYKLVASVVRLADGLDALLVGGKLDKLISNVNRRDNAEVRAALQALLELQDYFKRNPKVRDDVTATRDRLVEVAKRFDVTAKRYVALFDKHSAALDKACADPVVLFTELIGNVTELDRQRREAINALSGVSDTIVAMFGTLATDVPAAGPQHEAVSGTTLFGVPVGGILATEPGPDLDLAPGSWSWKLDGETNVDNIVYHLERAKKEILGAILPPLTYASDVVAEFTSLAAVVIGDAQRGARLAALVQKLDDLAKLVAGTLLEAPVRSMIGRLNTLGDLPEVKALRTEFETWRDKIDGVRTALRDRKIPVSNVTDLRVLFASSKAIRASIEAVAATVVGSLEDAGQDLLDDVERQVEVQLMSYLLRGLAAGQSAYDTVIKGIAPRLQQLAAVLGDAYSTLVTERNKVIDSLAPTPGDQSPAASIRQAIQLLLSACPAGADPKNDELAFQANLVVALAQKPPAEAATNLLALATAWSSTPKEQCTTPHNPQGPNAILIVLDQVTSAVDTLMRRDFSKLIDLGIIRKAVEDKLKQLVPSRITLGYDLDIPLSAFPDDPIFIPAGEDENLFPGAPDTRLTLRARTVIDLLDPGPPRVDLSGRIGPFAVRLIGKSFDVVTLIFDGARYGNDTGGKFTTNITGVELGEMVAFLDQFSQYFSFGASGFYVSVRYDLPGIEAGYRMPPINLLLGGLNIANLSLNASVILPFSAGRALFKVGLSRPESPFSITVGPYGGAGHLALYADAKGIIGFTASMEFGAIVPFTFGPLSGRGQVTAGVYIRSMKVVDAGGKETRISTIEGVFTAAGSANIACFRISAMLQVRVGQQPSGGVAGSAVFTFSFSLGIKDIEFRFVIAKTESKGYGGGGMSGGASAALDDRYTLPGPDGTILVADLSSDLPFPRDRLVRALPGPASRGPRLTARVPAEEDDADGYNRLFSEIEPWLPT